MFETTIAGYLGIGLFLVLGWPLRKHISDDVSSMRERNRRWESVPQSGYVVPEWKIWAFALMVGLTFCLLWPVVLTSWYRHHR
jgi:hypothetical protein